MAESKGRGQAFEETVRTKGWEYIKAYYLNKVQQFANSLLMEDKKEVVEFEAERRELIGLRKLIGFIENDIKVLRDSIEKEKDAKKAKGAAKK